MIRQNLLLTGDDGGYNLTKSLRFRSSASAYLNKTLSAGNQKTWTYSAWIKRGALADGVLFGVGSSGTSYMNIRLDGSDKLSLTSENPSLLIRMITSQVFRDPSAWYHILIVLDTTQATASNRIKFYINGSQVTAFTFSDYPSQNADLLINSNASHEIGRRPAGSDVYFDGYMAEVNFIGGSALTPSSFGSTNALTGVWQPAKYTGTYGTNGFYLPFTNTTSTSTLGNDFSGNSNTWTVNNISLTTGATYDSMNDVPTLTSATQANYCVFNPLASNAILTPSGGNLNCAGTDSKSVNGTIGVNSGKWYWEIVSTGTTPSYMGVTSFSYENNPDVSPTLNSSAPRSAVGSSASYYKNYTASAFASLATSINSSGTFGFALDFTTGELKYYKDNVLVNTDTTIPTNGTILFPYIGHTNTGTNSWATTSINFGQQPFTYTPPTGFVALNTFNLPTSTIVKGNTVMDATLYTGNGTGATDVQTITNASGFKPDLVWTKSRSNVISHHIGDSVRGINKSIFSNGTNSESTYTYDIHAFNSNGFTVGNDGSQNTSGFTYVGWQWQAGQGTTSSNTSGSITSTVSVNATAGFSVVTYTGTGSNATVGHGLGVAPSMIICKNRIDGTTLWSVYHSSVGAGSVAHLNTTAAFSASGDWNSTTPTSTVFSVGSSSRTNASTQGIVAYCWSEIAGFSKFGSYTGNGSTDGPFVYTGFRPKFVMIKRSDSADDWIMMDSSRSTYNVAILTLYANGSFAEDSNVTNRAEDFLSNGFKIRSSGVYLNASSGTYIYMAFAENPFKNALAR